MIIDKKTGNIRTSTDTKKFVQTIDGDLTNLVFEAVDVSDKSRESIKVRGSLDQCFIALAMLNDDGYNIFMEAYPGGGCEVLVVGFNNNSVKGGFIIRFAPPDALGGFHTLIAPPDAV